MRPSDDVGNRSDCRVWEVGCVLRCRNRKAYHLPWCIHDAEHPEPCESSPYMVDLRQPTTAAHRGVESQSTNTANKYSGREHEAYLPSNRHDLGGRRKCRYKQAFYCLATACLLFILLPRCLLLLLIVLWVTTVTRVITICIVTCILILMGRRLLPMIHPSLL